MTHVPLSAWRDYRRRHAIRVVGSRWPVGGELIVWVEVRDDARMQQLPETNRTQETGTRGGAPGDGVLRV